MNEKQRKRDIILKNINEEQIQKITDFISQNAWDIQIKPVTKKADKYVCEDTKFFIAPIESEKKCPYCFCQPCITSETNRQQWWGQGIKIPDVENSGLRKRCYQRFWAMYTHRHVWDIEQYKLKKNSIWQPKISKRFTYSVK